MRRCRELSLDRTRASRLRSERSSASTDSRSVSLSAPDSSLSRLSIFAFESCARSSSPIVGAVTSTEASERELTGPISEKAASASSSLALGISRSKEATASPLPRVRTEELRTIPS